MLNAGLDEAQAGIKIAGRNINNFRYADEGEEELKSPLMKVKEESEKVGLKLNIQKTKIMASSPIASWQIDVETVETVADFILGGSKITADGDCSHKIKRCLLLGRKVMTNLDSILKSRDMGYSFAPFWCLCQKLSLSPLYFNKTLLHTKKLKKIKSRDITLPTKVWLVKAMVFPVVIYGCESWTIKKAEHWRIVLEETLESPLDCEEIQSVHPKGN